MEFKYSEIEKFSNNLLEYLKQEDIIYLNNYKYVVNFIKHKGNCFSIILLQNFLITAVQNRKFHDTIVFQVIADILYEKKIKLTINKSCFNKIIEMAFGLCPTCFSKHNPAFITFFYRVLENKYQIKKIKTKLTEYFKSTKNRRVYYLSLINEIFKPEGDEFTKFICDSLPNDNNKSFETVFGGKSFPSIRINELINVCFKYGINLKEQRFNSFRAIDPYYMWLFDMKGFNYSKFNPQWVKEYSTIFYINEMRKYPIIQKRICEYLKNNHDPLLQNILMRIISK